MKYIYLIAVFNAALFITLLFQKKNRAAHDNILISWLSYLAFFIAIYAVYSHELFIDFRLLSISLLSLLMLHGPFLYVYIQTLISGRNKISWLDLAHLVPFFLFNFYILVSSFFTVSEKLNIERIAPQYDPPLLFLFFLILTAISGSVYLLLSVRLFKRLDINIFNNYSSQAKIDLNWLRKLVLIFGIVWTALIGITIIHHVLGVFSMAFCTDGLFLSLSVFVILIGYFGLKQRLIFAPEDVLTEGTNAKSRYSGSRLTDEESRIYADKLENHMRSSQSYLNPELSLAQLAKEIGISSHYLSQVINERFEISFFDFINKYRIEEFKKRVADPKYRSFSILGIALDCGFNSKSAFNRIFKQVTGLTPTQYRQLL